MPAQGSRATHPAVIRRGLGLLVRSVREEPRIFSLALAGSTIYALMTVASAYALGWITQHTILPAFSTGHTTVAALAGAAALIIGVSVVKCAGIVMRRIGAGTMQYRLMGAYRRRITKKYLQLPLSWHQDWTTGTLLSNANSDVEAMWSNITPFPLACGVIIMLFTTAGLLLETDWVLAIIGFVVFPLVGVLTYVYARAVAPRAMRAQELRGAVSSVAHDSFDGALVVKTLGREADETVRFQATALELRDSLVRLGQVRGLFDPAMEALPTLGVLAVLLAGSYRLAAGDINTGQLVQVAYLFTLLALPIRAIGFVFAEMPRSVVGAERVFGVLRAEGSMPYGDGVLTQTAAVGVGLRSVDYAYGAASPVLSDVTLDVAVGRTIAIVGPTGAGKSTLAGILVRLVDPTDGQVLYDDLDLRTLRQGEVSSAAALVPQQTFLFDDSVRGNVALGADFSDDDVWSALRTAQADRFVAALPAGLDTLVGERGTTLSGGQRQRLALARAVIRRPRLLLLDDATSSVDPSVEQAILAGLARTTGAATATSVLVVAYRRATIALADEVVFVDDGMVVARGQHEALLAEVEGYRALVTAYEQAEADREPAA